MVWCVVVPITKFIAIKLECHSPTLDADSYPGGHAVEGK